MGRGIDPTLVESALELVAHSSTDHVRIYSQTARSLTRPALIYPELAGPHLFAQASPEDPVPARALHPSAVDEFLTTKCAVTQIAVLEPFLHLRNAKRRAKQTQERNLIRCHQRDLDSHGQ